MKFSKRFELIMVRTGLSKKELAKKCAVSLYKVEKWLKGLSLPNLTDLIKICKGLNIRANWIIGLED